MRLAIRILLLSVVLLGTGLASPATARGDDLSGTVDVSLFYEPLATHGTWVRVDPYGWAWSPAVTEYSWQPYRLGHWVWTLEYGWVWVSDEPFGWATYHYGRWLYADDYGWLWLPGTVWAPAWVDWRYSDSWVGWAPLAPGSGWRIDSGPVASAPVGAYAWNFLPVSRLGETSLTRYYASSVYSPALVRSTTTTRSLAVAEDRIVNTGIERETVEKVRGTPITRHQVKTVATPGPMKTEGQTLVVPQPKFAARPSNVSPPAAKPIAPNDARNWVEERRKQMQRHLDEQRRAAEQDLDDQPAAETPKGPQGTPQGPGMAPAPPPDRPRANPDAAAKRRAEAAEALEQERKRLEDLLERQRRRLEQQQQSGMGGDQAPGMSESSSGMSGGSGMGEEEESGMDSGMSGMGRDV